MRQNVADVQTEIRLDVQTEIRLDVQTAVDTLRVRFDE